MRKTKTSSILARAALAVVLGASPAVSAAPLKADTAAPAGMAAIVMQTMGKFAKRDHGIDIQINSGQTLTKSALNLAEGKLDLSSVSLSGIAEMRAGAGPYAKLGEQAKDAYRKLRGLFGYFGGSYHVIVWADSGIESFADIKGRKVFTGPPAGAAVFQATGIIRVAAGYEPDKDYESVRLSWGAGLQAMQDGQVDVLIRPAPLGAAFIEQLGFQRQFRLLSLTPEDLQSEAWKKLAADPWRMPGTIPAETYAGQVNNREDVIAAAFTLGVAAHQDMDDETAYNLTRAFFDNLEEASATATPLKHLSADDALTGMNIPLHPGALRYFREKGIPVPDRLIPPEAR